MNVFGSILTRRKKCITLIEDLVKRMSSNVDQKSGIILMKLQLSNQDVLYLNKFLESPKDTSSLQDIFSNITFHNEEKDPCTQHWWYWHIDPNVVSCLVITFTCVLLLARNFQWVTWGKMLVYLIITSFVISFPWMWYKLYSEALAKHHVSMMKESYLSCQTTKSFGSFIMSLFSFSVKDECLRYYESVYVHPILEVPPTKALVATLSSFLLEPIEHLGTCISRTVRNILIELPVYMWPFVMIYFILVSVMIFMAVVMTKCRTNLFHCVKFEPSPKSGNKSTSIVRHM